MIGRTPPERRRTLARPRFAGLISAPGAQIDALSAGSERQPCGSRRFDSSTARPRRAHAAKFAELAAIQPATDDERFRPPPRSSSSAASTRARGDLQALLSDKRFGAAAALELAMCGCAASAAKAALALIEPVIETGGAEPAARLRALHLRALVAMRRVDMQAAVRTLLEASDGFEKLGPRRRHLAGQRLRSAQSMRRSARSIRRWAPMPAHGSPTRPLGDLFGVAITLGNLGRLNFQSGRYGDARHYFNNDIRLARQIGDVRGEANRC